MSKLNPPPSNIEQRRLPPPKSSDPAGSPVRLNSVHDSPLADVATESEADRPAASVSQRLRTSTTAQNGAHTRVDSANGKAATAASGRRFSQQFAAAMRWLHIYVSLLAFAALVFFGITGITLNHPAWFSSGEPRLIERSGQIDAALVRYETGADPEALNTKLEVVEFLRAEHKLRGAVSEFRTDEYECLILFKGPAYAADVIVDRADGSYQLTETMHGVVALMNDLHKGRDTGSAWSLVIDVVSLATVFVSLTGLVLIFYIKRKRVSGVVVAVAGTVLLIAVAYWLVP